MAVPFQVGADDYCNQDGTLNRSEAAVKVFINQRKEQRYM